MNQNYAIHSQSQVSHVVSEEKENLHEKDHKRRAKGLGRSLTENLSHGESITGGVVLECSRYEQVTVSTHWIKTAAS